MSTGDIVYKVDVDEKGATAGVKNFDKSIDEMGKTSGKANTAHTSLWKQVAVGAIAYKAATMAVRFLKDAIMDSIAAAMEQEKADKSLAASLEITGRPVKALTEHFKKYASELQKSTTFGDEAIEGAQTLLIQLTDLDRKGIDRATKGTIGLASVMGMDLNSATNLVAKALSGNVGALSQYGIQVSKTGTEEEKRIEILDKLEQFYGRATADTETYGGKLAQLKNSYGDLQEVVGFSIVKNEALRESINWVVEGLTNWLNADEALIAAEKKLHEQQNEEADLLGIVAVNAGMAYGEMAKLIESYKGNTDALVRDIQTGQQGVKMMYALKDARVEHTVALEKQRKEQEKAERGTNKFADATEDASKALEAQTKFLDKLEKEMKAADKRLEDWNKDVLKGGKAVADFNSELDMTPPRLGAAAVAAGMFADYIEKVISKEKQFGMTNNEVMDEMVFRWLDTADQIVGAMSTAYSFIDQIAQQSFKNKEILMDNEYKRQVENIENSKMNEEEKAAAMTALDEEYDAKRQELEKKKAKQQKDTAVMNAIISTYQAAAQTYASFGFPWGIIPAAIVTGLGMALVAKIRSQPIPLAKGAIFKQPTLLAGADGRDYQVAEPGSGGTEIVASPENIRKAIGGGGRSITLLVPIYIGGKKIQEQIIKIIEDTSQIGKLRIASKAVN